MIDVYPQPEQLANIGSRRKAPAARLTTC